MCVIAVHNEGVIPSKEDLAACERQNSDGIGIAWKDQDAVRFVKGINLDKLWAILQFIQDNKHPYVLHFRFATQGGKAKSLCHPFPVTDDMDKLFKMSGAVDMVLAHNGTWGDWRSSKLAKGRLIREGSDSAMMAYLLAKGYYLSKRTMSWHKVAVLSMKRGIRILGDWREDSQTGIRYSNMGWSYSRHSYSTTPRKERKSDRAVKVYVYQLDTKTGQYGFVERKEEEKPPIEMVDSQGTWRMNQNGNWIKVADAPAKELTKDEKTEACQKLLDRVLEGKKAEPKVSFSFKALYDAAGGEDAEEWSEWCMGVTSTTHHGSPYVSSVSPSAKFVDGQEVLALDDKQEEAEQIEKEEKATHYSPPPSPSTDLDVCRLDNPPTSARSYPGFFKCFFCGCDIVTSMRDAHAKRCSETYMFCFVVGCARSIMRSGIDTHLKYVHGYTEKMVSDAMVAYEKARKRLPNSYLV